MKFLRRPFFSAWLVLSLTSYRASAQPVAAPDAPAGDAPAEDAPAEDAPAPVVPVAEAPKEGSAEPTASAEEDAAMEDSAGTDELGGEFKLVPPKKGRAVLWGQVVDDNGEPLPEAQITVVQTGQKVISDFDGRFQVEVRPGSYSLRVFFEGPRLRLDGISVVADQTLRVETKVESRELDVDTIEVETEANRATIEGEILTRQRSAAVGDSVGRVEIAKTPDRNAAQAAGRVVGATIVDNRFVYVRGLGERYSNALLNDSPLPSPEPDRAAVPLDLFPTMVLDNLTIAKTFTPDYPGDFAGGSVRITTREIPEKFLFQVTGTGALNTQATFKDRLNYAGGSTDWLGIDDGGRSRPQGFPGFKLVKGLEKPAAPGTPTEAVTSEELTRAGLSINSFMTTKREFTPPDHGLSVVSGNGWKVGKDQKIGVLAAINYGRSYKLIEGQVRREYNIGEMSAVVPYRKLELDTGSDAVNWGAFGSLSYQASKHHKFSFLGFRSQLADDTTQVVSGTFETNGLQATRLTFVSKALTVGQLHGGHVFPDLNKAELDWTLALSQARRDQPDTRSIAFGRGAGSDSWSYQNDGDSGRHFWSDQTETGRSAKVDYTQPLASGASKLKFGGLLNQRNREFNARTMALRPRDGLPLTELGKLTCPQSPPGSGNSDFNQCADSLLNGSNIGPLVELQESTLPVDAYTADLDVYAGYLMADLQVLPAVRLIVGERVEKTHQSISPYDQFNPAASGERIRLESTDLLPAVAAVYDVDKKSKVRASLTRTLARPQLRELAPFAYSDLFGGASLAGNPALTLTHITNSDLRYEYFPTLKEVLAVSLFHKRFQDPIETVAVPSGGAGTVTFQNATAASLFGAELEARKSLDFLARELAEFSVIGNLTVAASKIELNGLSAAFLTNSKRPMLNQAPYIFNLSLDYTNAGGTTARALYNVTGPRIVQVGASGLPDAYMHPRNRIDLTLSQRLLEKFELKFVARDILNSKVLVTQGRHERSDNVVDRYTEGTLLALSASYTH